MAKSAVGVFEDGNAAQRAIAALQHEGFSASDIHLIRPSDAERGHAILSAPRVDREHLYGGAMAAGLVGSFAGLLIAIGMFNFTHGNVGMRLLYALIALLVTAVFGAVLGALVGTITGAGIPEEHREYYLEAVKRGGTLVVVTPSTSVRADFAARILWDQGAADIEHMIESWHGLAHP